MITPEWPVYQYEDYRFMLPGDEDRWRYFANEDLLQRYGYDPSATYPTLTPEHYKQYPYGGPIAGVGELPSIFTQGPWVGEEPWRPTPGSGPEWPVYQYEDYRFMLPGDEDRWRYFANEDLLQRYGYDPSATYPTLTPEHYKQYPYGGPIAGVGELPSIFTQGPWVGEEPWRPGPEPWLPDEPKWDPPRPEPTPPTESIPWIPPEPFPHPIPPPVDEPREPYPYELGDWDPTTWYPEGWNPGDWDPEQWPPDWWMPSFPTYQPFPTDFPPYEGSRYEAMGVPESFYEGVIIPQLKSYQAGQLGDYPTYGRYESGLLQAGQQTLMDLLGGEGVGIPFEAEQWQTAMGRITASERRAQEELTRLSARGGRIESGLYGAQQQEITEATMQQRGETAQDFAIRTAEMQRQAQEYAIPQALQYGQFGAGEARYTYESHTEAWGVETADLFREYESKMEVATTDYEMRTAQQEMVAAGQERAWQVASTEYTKVYESNLQAGMLEFEAVKEARQAALAEYMKLYESVVQDVQWNYEWIRSVRTWREQREQIKLGAAVAAPTFWDYFAGFAGRFAEGFGAATGAAAGV